MAYVYRFLDTAYNTIYVGKTVNIDRRIKDHFTRGHLARECYDSVKVIEYIKVNTEADSLLVEQYFINKYHPRYNKQGKCKGEQTVKIDIEEKWKRYKMLNPKIKAEVKSKEIKRIAKWKIMLLEVSIWVLLAYTIIKLLIAFI